MSTIAFDGKQVACDSQVGSSYRIEKASWNKAVAVFGHEKYWCMGGTGECDAVAAFMEWIMEGGDYPALCADRSENNNYFAVGYDGLVYEFERRGTPCLHVSAPWSGGSGSDYALGAMDHGASATEAIRIAMKRDPHSGGQVIMIPFPMADASNG